MLRLIKVDIQGRRRTGTWDVVPGVAGGDANRVGLRQPAQVARRPGERQGAAADAVGDVRRIAGDGADADHGQHAVGEAEHQSGIAALNAGEVASVRSRVEQLEAVAGRQRVGIRGDVGDDQRAAVVRRGNAGDHVVRQRAARLADAHRHRAVHGEGVVDGQRGSGVGSP